MATNVGFDNGHPYVEEGADEGDIAISGDRISVGVKGAGTSALDLERSIDGGVSWEPLISKGSGAALIDCESLSYGDTWYRATAYSAEGAAAEKLITVPARSDAIWLSTGTAFEQTARLPFNPTKQVTAGRDRAGKQFAGRPHLVAMVGEALSKVVAISGTTADRDLSGEETANVERLVQILQSEHAVHLVRTPDGDRTYGIVENIALNRQLSTTHDDPARPWNGIWGYQFQITETERGE